MKRKIEYAKSQVRAKVEHPFRVIKRQFGYTKVRFRGLVKNTAQQVTLVFELLRKSVRSNGITSGLPQLCFVLTRSGWHEQRA